MGVHKITPRTEYAHPIAHTVGCIFTTNISPTIYAQLVGYDDKLAYFVTTENEQWTKYNSCKGQEFWIPLTIAVCMNPVELSCKLDR